MQATATRMTAAGGSAAADPALLLIICFEGSLTEIPIHVLISRIGCVGYSRH